MNAKKKRLREKMIAQARRRHFRTADTLAFDAQFSTAATAPQNTPHIKPITYNIPERAKIVRLVCSSGEGLSDRERFQRRIEVIEARTALCSRWEAQRRGRPKVIIKQEDSATAMEDSDTGMKDFPLVCQPTQCLFCLGNDSFPYHHRVYEYAKPHQMMNEVGKHLKSFAQEDPVACPHPRCKAAGLAFPSVMVFKNHAGKVHKSVLRAWSPLVSALASSCRFVAFCI